MAFAEADAILFLTLFFYTLALFIRLQVMTWSFFKKTNILLVFILLVSLLLRFYHLNYQSLWLDELHTMREGDPAMSWGELFSYLKNMDLHPPLFYGSEKIFFTIFGYSDRVARLFPALYGVLGVWAMYLLGKETINRNLGLIAAAFTAVNAFCIQYSQEARAYSLVFLCTTLSFLFFIKIIKQQRKKDSWLYALFTLLVMYSHYFGLLVPISQGLIAIVFFVINKAQRKALMRSMLMAGLIIAVGYSVWAPSLLKLSEIKDTWIPPSKNDFFLDYFSDYFGNLRLLVIIGWGLFIFFLLTALPARKKPLGEHVQNPLIISCIVITAGIFLMLFIPYVRSVRSVPMLVNRYTIIVLPLILLGISLGTWLIPNKVIKMATAGIFILLSLKGLNDTQYYTKISKTQYRELTNYITANQIHDYPVINTRTGWQHLYYTRKSDKKLRIAEGDPKLLIDSMTQRSRSGEKNIGFWLVDAHVATPPDQLLTPELKAVVDSNFTLSKEQQFFDSWVRLYVSKR